MRDARHQVTSMGRRGRLPRSLLIASTVDSHPAYLAISKRTTGLEPATFGLGNGSSLSGSRSYGRFG